MENKIDRLRVHNGGDLPLRLILEPWGDCLVVPCGGSVEVVMEGPQGPDAVEEVVWGSESLTVYGWPGATLKVFDGDSEVLNYDFPVPEMPPRVADKD